MILKFGISSHKSSLALFQNGVRRRDTSVGGLLEQYLHP